MTFSESFYRTKLHTFSEFTPDNTDTFRELLPNNTAYVPRVYTNQY